MKSVHRVKCYSIPIIPQTHTKNTLCSLNRNQKISRRLVRPFVPLVSGCSSFSFYGLPRDKWASGIRSAVIEEASQLSAGKTHPPAVNPLLGLDSVNLSQLHFALSFIHPQTHTRLTDLSRPSHAISRQQLSRFLAFRLFSWALYCEKRGLGFCACSFTE